MSSCTRTCHPPDHQVMRRQLRTNLKEIGILSPNDQRQHRTLHIQKDVLPDALC